MTRSYHKGALSIPLAIVVAGLIIAGAVIVSSDSGASENTADTNNEGRVRTASADDFRMVSGEDHLRGNPDAAVTVVEFSDFECPFCARLHPTLSRIIDERPDEVNWVYRHFPLTTIHSRARSAAIAAECVADLAGNDAFWDFADFVFENQRQLGPELYEQFVVQEGIASNALTACMSDQKIAQEVDRDNQEARSLGGTGTPFSVIVTANGELIPFSGAIPYENVNAVIDQALES